MLCTDLDAWMDALIHTNLTCALASACQQHSPLVSPSANGLDLCNLPSSHIHAGHHGLPHQGGLPSNVGVPYAGQARQISLIESS